MPPLFSSDLQPPPTPSSSSTTTTTTPAALPPPSSPISTTSSWLRAGGREKRANADPARTGRQGPVTEKGVGGVCPGDFVIYFMVADTLKMLS